MTGKQRLRVLANYLTSGAVDEEKFDMSRWDHCAIGEGSRLPSLQKEGLTLETSSDGDIRPVYHGDSCFFACSEFFHISYALANKFFGEKRRKAKTVGRQLLKYLNVKRA